MPGVQGLVGGRIERDGAEVALAPIGPNDGLDRGRLGRVAEARVGFAVQVARSLDRAVGKDRNGARLVLHDRHDRLDRRSGGHRECQGILEADPAVGLSRGKHRFGSRAAVGQYLEVDAGIAIPAHGLGHVEARVVSIGGPVEGESNGRRSRRWRGQGRW